MFATTSFGELVLFWLIVIPLAFHGFRKLGKVLDPKGEVKEATKVGLIDIIKRKLK